MYYFYSTSSQRWLKRWSTWMSILTPPMIFEAVRQDKSDELSQPQFIGHFAAKCPPAASHLVCVLPDLCHLVCPRTTQAVDYGKFQYDGGSVESASDPECGADHSCKNRDWSAR